MYTRTQGAIMRYAISGVNGNFVPVRRESGGPVAHEQRENTWPRARSSHWSTLRHVGPPDLPPHLPSPLRLNVDVYHHRITRSPPTLSSLWPILSVPDYILLLVRSSPIVSSFIALLPPSLFRPPSSMPSRIRATFTP